MARYAKAREFTIRPDVVVDSISAVIENGPWLHACGHAASDERWASYVDNPQSSFAYYVRENNAARIVQWFNEVFTRKACSPECEAELIKAERKAKAAARKADPEHASKKTAKAAIRENPYANLPTIIDILGTTDSGEYGAALCPHCGAEGRYIKHVICDDGTERGVMAGCFKKFPQHPVVQRIAYYQDKWDDYKKKGWNLSRFDQQIHDAIEAMRAGTKSADDVLMTIRTVAAQRERWQKNRRGW